MAKRDDGMSGLEPAIRGAVKRERRRREPMGAAASRVLQGLDNDSLAVEELVHDVSVTDDPTREREQLVAPGAMNVVVVRSRRSGRGDARGGSTMRPRCGVARVGAWAGCVCGETLRF